MLDRRATSSRFRARARRGSIRRRPPPLRRRRVGSQRAPPRADPPPLRPDLQALVPGRVGALRPAARRPAARCSSRTTRGAIPPDAPAIMHGIEKRARPAGLRPRREPVPLGAGRRHAVGARRRRRRASRQRVPAAARRRAARARVPRGHEGHRQALHRALPAAPLRARRLRRDRDARRRAGDPDRGGRRRGGDADRVQEQPRREAARPPLLPGHREHADDGPARARRLPARRSSACACCRPCTSTSLPIRSATRAAG